MTHKSTDTVSNKIIYIQHIIYVHCFSRSFFVLIISTIHIVIFWVMTPCRLLGVYPAFGGTSYLHTTQRRNSRDNTDTLPRQPDS